jgi:hypothetical protein
MSVEREDDPYFLHTDAIVSFLRVGKAHKINRNSLAIEFLERTPYDLNNDSVR